MNKIISKTSAALFTASIFTLFACSSDSGDTPNPEPSSNSVDVETSSSSDEGGISSSENISSNSVVSSSSVQSSSSVSSSSGSQSSSSIFCKSNDLGKGYDVVGSPYINWTKVNNILVLDQDKMCQDGILELDKAGSAQQYASFSGNTIKELYSKRNENMKISASLGASIDIAFVFSVDFEAKFAKNTSSGSQQSSTQKYYYSQIRSYLYTGEDQIKGASASAQSLSKYLTSDFISDLKSTKSAAQILDRYGSHIFIQYYKGGSLEANYTYTGSESSSRFTSASQMEIAAKASFKKIDGAVDYGTGNSNEASINELEQHMSFNYESYGGDEIKATSMTQLGSEYTGWVSSIKNNARTTGIKDFAQSFIPIWDLAQQIEGVTSTRLNALKDEFKRRAEAQGLKFPVAECNEESCYISIWTTPIQTPWAIYNKFGNITYENNSEVKFSAVSGSTYDYELQLSQDGYDLRDGECYYIRIEGDAKGGSRDIQIGFQQNYGDYETYYAEDFEFSKTSNIIETCAHIYDTGRDKDSRFYINAGKESRHELIITDLCIAKADYCGMFDACTDGVGLPPGPCLYR